ncbi:hypothetical protein GGI02_006136, partial [Coemansia sp. RSA 2322]
MENAAARPVVASRHNLLLQLPLAAPLSPSNAQAVQEAVERTTDELAVFVVLADMATASQVSCGWTQMQRRIAELYAVASAAAATSGNADLDVDVVPLDFCAYSVDDMAPYRANTTLLASSTDLPRWWPAEMHNNAAPICLGAASHSSRVSQSPRTPVPWTSYAHVTVGGTFDHLHVGHKMLLTATALAATKRVVCGISADALLENKQYKELIEPFRTRELNVLLFLRRIRKDIIIELVPIVDRYGPTITDATIAALVVSQETLPGSDALNVRRAELGMPPMQILPIDLISEPLGEAAANSHEPARLK